MSTFDNPFDPDRRLRTGCACGLHSSQAEHESESRRQLQCLPVEREDLRYEKDGRYEKDRRYEKDLRYENVVVSAVMRAVFPNDAGRRAFLKSVGASTALAVLSQLFPLKSAT
jgi:nitrate/nitrite transport system substrate-binding protein